jgi:hypothetical protein
MIYLLPITLIIRNKLYNTKQTNFEGTAIRMRLIVTIINSERKARENSQRSVIRVSKVSRMLTVLMGEMKIVIVKVNFTPG